MICFGELSEKDKAEAMKLTEQDNYFLDKLKGQKLTEEQIKMELKHSDYYKDATDEELKERSRKNKWKIKSSKQRIFKMVWMVTCMCIRTGRILGTKTNTNVPKNIKKTRNRKRSYAIPNNNFNAYENWKGKRRNDIRMVRKIF